jgi:hypothetical protein
VGDGRGVEGDTRSLRLWVEEHEHAHVLAVSGKEDVWRAGRHEQVTPRGAPWGAEGWCRLSAGDGAQGPRWYDWRWLPLAAPLPPDWRRGLLGRRSLRAPTDLAASVGFAPHATGLDTVVQVAGSRGTMERCFAEATGEVGLAQAAVRRGTGWSRPRTLARWAYALLTVLRAAHLPAAPP